MWGWRFFLLRNVGKSSIKKKKKLATCEHCTSYVSQQREAIHAEILKFILILIFLLAGDEFLSEGSFCLCGNVLPSLVICQAALLDPPVLGSKYSHTHTILVTYTQVLKCTYMRIFFFFFFLLASETASFSLKDFQGTLLRDWKLLRCIAAQGLRIIFKGICSYCKFDSEFSILGDSSPA